MEVNYLDAGQKKEIPMEQYEGYSSQSDHITAKIHIENIKITKKNSWDFFSVKKD